MSSGRPKVLLIHHSGLMGGAGKSLYDLWLALESEFDVVAMVPDSPPDIARFLQAQGLDPITFSGRMPYIPFYSGGENIWSPRLWYHTLAIPVQAGKWRRAIKQHSPDIVLVNSGVLAWFGLITGGTPSICYVRETVKGHPRSPVNRILRRLRDRFTAVIFLSEYDRRSAAQQKASSIVVPDAVEPSDYIDTSGKAAACQALHLPSDTFNLLLAGGFSALKGFDVAVEGLRYLPPQVHLVVAGLPGAVSGGLWRGRLNAPARFRARMERRIQELSLSDRIHFVGVQAEMRAPYSACDLVVFPMNEPHQARPAFEAGFQSKTIVITNFPNMAGCIVDEVNALTFEPHDPARFAECVHRLYSDGDLRSRLGKANELHAYDKHTRTAGDDLLRGILRDLPTHAAAIEVERTVRETLDNSAF